MKTNAAILALSMAIALAGCGKKRDEVETPSSLPVPQAAETAPVSANAPTDVTANPSVGGAAMLPTRTIVENAMAASNLTTLVRAIKAADLTGTLSGPGPFTVFAPSNDAFARLAPGTVENLLKPENKGSLVKILTYHVVPGRITAADLSQRIVAGGGTAALVTVEGEPITVSMQGNIVALTDVNGNRSYVEVADVRQSNGVVHVVNGVLVPKIG